MAGEARAAHLLTPCEVGDGQTASNWWRRVKLDTMRDARRGGRAGWANWGGTVDRGLQHLALGDLEVEQICRDERCRQADAKRPGSSSNMSVHNGNGTEDGALGAGAGTAAMHRSHERSGHMTGRGAYRSQLGSRRLTRIAQCPWQYPLARHQLHRPPHPLPFRCCQMAAATLASGTLWGPTQRQARGVEWWG